MDMVGSPWFLIGNIAPSYERKVVERVGRAT